MTLFDELVVIGGGFSVPYTLFAQSMFVQLESKLRLHNPDMIDRLSRCVFNLEDPIGISRLLNGKQIEISIPDTNKTIPYDPFFRSGIGFSKNGTSLMIDLGAYAFVLKKLNQSIS